MGQNVHIRAAVGRPRWKKNHDQSTNNLSWIACLWIFSVVVSTSVNAYPAAPEASDDVEVTTDEWAGVPVVSPEDPITEAPSNELPVDEPTLAPDDSTVESEVVIEPELADATETVTEVAVHTPGVSPAAVTETIQADEEQVAIIREQLRNHPEIPDDVNLDDILQRNIYFAREKDGDSHILIRIPSKHSNGSLINPDLVTGAPNEPYLDVNGNEIKFGDNDDGPGIAHGWFTDDDGTWNWLAILFLMFLLFI